MFKINYCLREPKQIVPWGDEEKSLHWFGLTDGLLWINVGESVIYEYSESAMKLLGSERYNDYQLARFLTDLSDILPYVAESIPKSLYDIVDTFENDTYYWNLIYADKSDKEYFDYFLPDFFEPLYTWYEKRTFDSLHLVGGPVISCFRCEDKVKIRWVGGHTLDDGNDIWKYPDGLYEMKYSEFISAVTQFFQAFECDMEKQVNYVLENGIDGVYIDTDQLIRDNEIYKTTFSQKVNSLHSPASHSDWEKILSLYNKMISEVSE